MGSASVHETVRLPPPNLNSDVAHELEDITRWRNLFTWPRVITEILNQVTRGMTSDGSKLTKSTRQMVKDMVHVNSTFMQESMVFDRLLDGTIPSVNVDKYVDAVPTSPIGDALAELADKTLTALQSDVDKETLANMLKKGFEKYHKDGENFYNVEQAISGDPHLIAERTENTLSVMVKESILSGENTVILAENAHFDALEAHNHDAFDKYFGSKKFVGFIYCYSTKQKKRVAARLFRISQTVKILVTSSYFLINAPGKSIVLRLNLCAEILAVKSTLVQAGLMDNRSLDKLLEQLKAFAIQLFDSLSHSQDISREMLAIKNNSPVGYYFGRKGKKGLQPLINILAKEIGIKRIFHETMASFAMTLGAKGLQRLYAVFGHDIDCYNMAATMLRLEDEQEDLGVTSKEHRQLISRTLTGRSRGAMTEEQKQLISRTMTGRTFTEEQRQTLTGRTHTVAHRQSMSRGISRAYRVKKQANAEVKEARNREFDNFTPSRNELEGELSAIRWDRKNTSWFIKLVGGHFDRELYVASFTRLRDAKAAMKYLSKAEALRGLRARLPSNNSKFDCKERRNKKILDKAIKKVRLDCNAKTNAGKPHHTTNIF